MNNRMKALTRMNKHLAVLLAETPSPSKEADLLNSAIDQLNEYSYYVAVSTEGSDTKKRYGFVFWTE